MTECRPTPALECKASSVMGSGPLLAKICAGKTSGFAAYDLKLARSAGALRDHASATGARWRLSHLDLAAQADFHRFPYASRRTSRRLRASTEARSLVPGLQSASPGAKRRAADLVDGARCLRRKARSDSIPPSASRCPCCWAAAVPSTRAVAGGLGFNARLRARSGGGLGGQDVPQRDRFKGLEAMVLKVSPPASHTASRMRYWASLRKPFQASIGRNKPPISSSG